MWICHLCKRIGSKYPGLEKALKTIRFPENKNKTRAAIVYIPVVVHVVSKNGQEDIPEVYIQAQIDQLNRCYGRTNSDTTNMRSIYQSRVGATKIRFWLDQIRRVTTTIPNFDWNSLGAPDYVKETANGGDDAISPSTKLNVWICDLTINGVDGLVGYAYPPAGLPNWGGGGNAPIPGYDGVVLDFQDVGGPNKHPYGYASLGLRGKTLVHEVGHYLGLRHIWGDDGGACTAKQILKMMELQIHQKLEVHRKMIVRIMQIIIVVLKPLVTCQIWWKIIWIILLEIVKIVLRKDK